MTETRNRLTTIQTVKLSNWLAENVATLSGRNISREMAADMATKSLGFRVVTANITRLTGGKDPVVPIPFKQGVSGAARVKKGQGVKARLNRIEARLDRIEGV